MHGRQWLKIFGDQLQTRELPAGGDHVFRETLISSSRYLERENPRSLISLTSKSLGRAIAMQRLGAEVRA